MNIGMMATYPVRKKSLRKMLRTILPQLDLLYIYCNQYRQKDLSELGDWASSQDFNCTVKIIDPNSEDGDVRDMGKFWALGAVEGTVFLLDDDLHYPDDYVQKHILAIQLHQCITTVHGRKVKRYPLSDYFRDTKSYHYRQGITTPARVHIAGTGTCAFPTSLVPESFYANQQSMAMYQGMADIWFACQALIHNIDIVSIPRAAGWLNDIPSAKASASLYQETRQDSSLHCKRLNKLTWL